MFDKLNSIYRTTKLNEQPSIRYITMFSLLLIQIHECRRVKKKSRRMHKRQGVPISNYFLIIIPHAVYSVIQPTNYYFQTRSFGLSRAGSLVYFVYEISINTALYTNQNDPRTRTSVQKSQSNLAGLVSSLRRSYRMFHDPQTTYHELHLHMPLKG